MMTHIKKKQLLQTPALDAFLKQLSCHNLLLKWTLCSGEGLLATQESLVS